MFINHAGILQHSCGGGGGGWGEKIFLSSNFVACYKWNPLLFQKEKFCFSSNAVNHINSQTLWPALALSLSTKDINNNNNNNNNNNGHLLCAGIRPKTLMAQAIIIALSLSGNHQNHFAFKGMNGCQETYEIFHVYCIVYSGFMCQTTIIFGITKDGSLVLNT